jgi:hypothetical protein
MKPARNMFQKKCFIAFITLIIITGTFTAAYAQDPVEVGKIEYLINRLETMKDVIFIRNGTGYNAKEAANHLRMKWKNGGNHIKTVDDFIRLCASRSYVTGKPYKIRFPNGYTEDAAVVLRKILKDRSDQSEFQIIMELFFILGRE